MSKSNAKHYHAYLLRFWREDGSKSWRATLEDPHSGEIVGFASMWQLFSFLNEKSVHQGSELPPSLTGDIKTT